MKYIIRFLLLTCLLCPFLFFGQIRISEQIQTSTIARHHENALYFVDFWATWCGPCIHVSKYLETLQKQYSKDFYIISLSQESPEMVKQFMLKHNMELAVAIDYEGETFLKHKISSLPYGILFNAQGVKLWEGHPANLKAHHIEKYLRNNKKKVVVNSFIKLQEYKKQAVAKEFLKLENDFHFFETSLSNEEMASVQVINKDGFLELKGTLQNIMAYILSSNKKQIEIPEYLNKQYYMLFKEGTEAFKNKETYIVEELKLNRVNTEKEGNAIVLNIVSPSKLWDTEQINWGIGNQKYLIGDTDIQADNVTLGEMAYQLSYVLDTPVVFSSDYKNSDLHDWQIHYKYYELMSSNLFDYGIEVDKRMIKYPQYIITKKAP